MTRPTKSIPQEPYIRTREDPKFVGLIDVHTSKNQKVPVFGNISRSVSDIGDVRAKTLISDIFDKSAYTPFDDSLIDAGFHSKTPSFEVKYVSFDDEDLSDEDYSRRDDQSSPSKALEILETTEEYYQIVPFRSKLTFEKSYEVQRRRPDQSKFPPLPQSAASFYNGFLPAVEIVELCVIIKRLNFYLKARRDDVSAGVPGKFLHAVMGQDASDVGSVVGTIMHAFYLNETLENDRFCTVPVINMKRADLSYHHELQWLLDLCQIDDSFLIFVDEIDLSYYDLFGSLKLVLLNDHKLPSKQEALKESVVEIFNCRKGESVYPWVETVTVGQDASCCTLVAENFALTSPEILASRGFSKLLLAAILLDTGNLSSADCTPKDKYMATLLINGAGRFGCNGLYQMLKYKMHDVSDLTVIDILRKDFKKWTRVGNHDFAGSRMMVSYIGMSTIGMPIEQLLAHNNTATEDITYFQQLEKLRLLMVVSGYYDSQKSFKREILVAAESVELMKNLFSFLNLNASQLPLKVRHLPGLRDEMKAFEVDKVTSRKTIEHLLEEFGGASRG